MSVKVGEGLLLHHLAEVALGLIEHHVAVHVGMFGEPVRVRMLANDAHKYECPSWHKKNSSLRALTLGRFWRSLDSQQPTC